MNTPPDLVSRSPEETEAVGEVRLRPGLGPGSVVAVYGDLGAGKTCLVRGIARGLGVREPVTSPSYDLVHLYRGDLPLAHVDLYRVGSPAEALDLGLDEWLFGDGVTVVEWAERIEGLLPAGTIRVRIFEGVGPGERRLRIEPPGGGA